MHSVDLLHTNRDRIEIQEHDVLNRSRKLDAIVVYHADKPFETLPPLRRDKSKLGTVAT